MPQVRVQASASRRLDEIYRYTHDRCGAQQADSYITGLFATFDGIVTTLHKRMHQIDCFREDTGV